MHLPADFDAEIYDIVAQIPAGRVVTYGQLARLAGMPGYARRVGRAMATAPAGIPSHRVVSAAGRHGPRMDRPAGAARSGGHPFPAQRVCGPRPPKR